MKKIIFSAAIFFILVVIIFTQTALGDKFSFPFGFIADLFNFQKDNKITLEDYPDGYIVLVKPEATGSGKTKAEAGDVVEIRSVKDLKKRFGNDKEFLGEKEKTKLLAFYYPGELTENQKQKMMSPVYEGKARNEFSITSADKEARSAKLTGLGQRPAPANGNRVSKKEPKIIKNRAYGIDYTEILSEKDILIAKNPNKGFEKLPMLNLDYLIKKEETQQSAVKEFPKIVKIKETLDNLFPKVNAAGSTSTSIVDPDNGTGTDYTSLNAWESGEEADLVTNNESKVATCRSTGGSADTTGLDIGGWTTDSDNYIKIWTDPAEDYRHDGTAGSGYRLLPGTGKAVRIRDNQDYINIEGIELGGGSSGDYDASVYIEASSYIDISYCLMHGSKVGVWITNGSENGVKIWNNIIYNTTDVSIIIEGGDTDANVVYNNTVYNSGSHGVLLNSWKDAYITNNIVVDSTNNDFEIESDAEVESGSGHNISSDATAPGSNSKTSVSLSDLDFTNTSSGNEDFHIGQSSVAKNAGKDLSSDANLPFSDDIDGSTRIGAWDIGADEETTIKEFESIVDPDNGAGTDYTSLYNWEDGVETDLTATSTIVFSHGGITGSIADTDSVTGATTGATADVVHATDDQILLENISGNFESGEQVQVDASNHVTISDAGNPAIALATCRSTGGSADTTGVSIDGWTTDSSRYIKIWTDPAEDYRHDGTAGSGYVLNYSSGFHGISIGDNIGFTVIDGLEITTDQTEDNRRGVLPNDNDQGEGAIIKNCLIHLQGNSGHQGITSLSTYNHRFDAYNNIIYNCEYGIRQETNSYGKFYNNTVYNCDYGIYYGNESTIVNNIAANCSTNCFYDEGDGTGTTEEYNIATDGTVSGTGSLANETLNNINFISTAPGSEDLHINNNSIAKNGGTNISGVFNTDIDGDNRIDPWDVGADELITFKTQINSPYSGFMTSGLVGYWTFDGQNTDWGSGMTNDISGNDNHGEMVKMSTSTSPARGKIGQGLKFNGSTNAVDVGDVGLDFHGQNQSFSVAFWMKKNGGNNNDEQYMVSTDVHDGWYLRAGNGSDHDELIVKIDDGADHAYNWGSTTITDGEWYHCALVLDTTTDTLYGYVNGVEEINESSVNVDDMTYDDVAIGRGEYGGDHYFQGLLDEVRIYNRALSASEIESLYRHSSRKLQVNSQINKYATGGLVGYWTFDGQDTDWGSNITNDLSGNGNNGEITNMSTSTSPASGKIGQALKFDNSGDSGYRIKVTVEYTEVDANLTDFPVYVDMSDLGSNFFSHTNSGCADVRVKESDGSTEVPREIVACDTTAETGELHFKASSLSSSFDTDFYIYYGTGDSDYARDATYGLENVWTNDYVGVWHLEEDPGPGGSGDIIDSTNQTNHGTAEASMTSADSVTGVMGNAIEFDGSDDLIDLGNPSILDFSTGDWSVETWHTISSGISQETLYAKGGDNTPGVRYTTAVGEISSDVLALTTDDNSTKVQVSGNDDVADGTNWYYGVGMRSGGTNLYTYVDGVQDASDTCSSGYDLSGTSQANAYIGAIYNAGSSACCIKYFSGTIDEVRVSNDDRTSGWLSTQYNNHSAPGTFLTVGSEEDLSSDGEYVDLGNVTDLNNASEVTVVGWFKDNNHSGDERPWGKSVDGNNDFNAATWSNGSLYFEVGNSGNSFGYWSDYSTTVSEGEWYHAAFVFNGNGGTNPERMKVYVNGVNRNLSFSGTIPATTADLSSANLTIGKDSYSGDNFNGQVDEFRIYNRALSASEINKIYRVGTRRIRIADTSSTSSSSGCGGCTGTEDICVMESGGDYSDLATALSNASAGDTIEIAGTWSSADTSACTVSDNNVTIKTVCNARHDGYMPSSSPSIYRLEVSGSHAITVNNDGTTIDGLIIKQAGTGTSDECIRMTNDGGALTVKDTIVWAGSKNEDQDGIYAGDISATVNLENVIGYGFGRAAFHPQGYSGTVTQTWNVNSCTAWDNGSGAEDEAGGINVNLQNASATYDINIFNSVFMDTDASGGGSADYGTDGNSAASVTWDIHNSIDSDGSISSRDASASNCLTSHNSTDDNSKSSDGDWVIFEDITSSPYDLRLATNSYNEAQDAHTDSSGAGISMPDSDIAGTSRPQNTNYDIGAFEIP